MGTGEWARFCNNCGQPAFQQVDIAATAGTDTANQSTHAGVINRASHNAHPGVVSYPTTAAHPGVPTHPVNAPHSGAVNNSTYTAHPGLVINPTPAIHPGVAINPTYAAHAGVNSHPVNAGNPEPVKNPTSKVHAGLVNNAMNTAHPGVVNNAMNTADPGVVNNAMNAAHPGVPSHPTYTEQSGAVNNTTRITPPGVANKPVNAANSGTVNNLTDIAVVNNTTRTAHPGVDRHSVNAVNPGIVNNAMSTAHPWVSSDPASVDHRNDARTACAAVSLPGGAHTAATDPSSTDTAARAGWGNGARTSAAHLTTASANAAQSKITQPPVPTAQAIAGGRDGRPPRWGAVPDDQAPKAVSDGEEESDDSEASFLDDDPDYVAGTCWSVAGCHYCLTLSCKIPSTNPLMHPSPAYWRS